MKNRHTLGWGLQDKLERFYKKFKKDCVFGKYPKNKRGDAYDLIISSALDYMEAHLPAIHKHQKEEGKRIDKQLKQYKKSKRYKEDKKWLKNHKKMILPSSKRKK